MATSYSVSINIIAKSNLRTIEQQVNRLNKQFQTLQKTFGTNFVANIGKVSSAFRKLNAQLRNLQMLDKGGNLARTTKELRSLFKTLEKFGGKTYRIGIYIKTNINDEKIRQLKEALQIVQGFSGTRGKTFRIQVPKKIRPSQTPTGGGAWEEITRSWRQAGQIMAIGRNVFNILQAPIKAVQYYMKALGKFDKYIRQIAQGLYYISGMFRLLGYTMTMLGSLIGYQLIRGFRALTQMLDTEYKTALASTMFITKDVADTTKLMNDAFEATQKAAQETGVALKDVADALYFIGSAGYKNFEVAQDVLKQISVVSWATGAKPADIFKSLITLTNAYGIEMEKSGEVLNAIVKAVSYGVFEMSDLSTLLQRVAAFADLTNASLTELLGTIVGLSQTGLKPRIIGTSFSQFLMDIVKKEEKFREAGIRTKYWTGTGWEQLSPYEIMKQVAETYKTPFARQQLIQSLGLQKRSLLIFQTYLEQFDKINKGIQDIKEGQEENVVKEYYKNMQNTVSYHFNRVVAAWDSLKTMLLQIFKGDLNSWLDRVYNGIGRIQIWLKKDENAKLLRELIGHIIKIALLLTVLGAIFIGISLLIRSISGVIELLRPNILLMAGLITGLVSGSNLLEKKKFQELTFEDLKNLNLNDYTKLLESYFEGTFGFGRKLGEKFSELFKSQGEILASPDVNIGAKVGVLATDVIRTIYESVADFTDKFVEYLNKGTSEGLDEGTKSAFKTIKDNLMETAKSFFKVVGNVLMISLKVFKVALVDFVFESSGAKAATLAGLILALFTNNGVLKLAGITLAIGLSTQPVKIEGGKSLGESIVNEMTKILLMTIAGAYLIPNFPLAGIAIGLTVYIIPKVIQLAGALKELAEIKKQGTAKVQYGRAMEIIGETITSGQMKNKFENFMAATGLSGFKPQENESISTFLKSIANFDLEKVSSETVNKFVNEQTTAMYVLAKLLEGVPFDKIANDLENLASTNDEYLNKLIGKSIYGTPENLVSNTIKTLAQAINKMENGGTINDLIEFFKNSAMFQTNKGMASGGYTGKGAKFEPAGIVHKGEYVLPKWMVENNPELIAMLEKARKGYAGGGLVETLFKKGFEAATDRAISDFITSAVEKISFKDPFGIVDIMKNVWTSNAKKGFGVIKNDIFKKIKSSGIELSGIEDAMKSGYGFFEAYQKGNLEKYITNLFSSGIKNFIEQTFAFATGGFTGSGTTFEPAGIVHKGEYVVPQWLVRKYPNLIAKIETARKRGFAHGVRDHPSTFNEEIIDTSKNKILPIDDLQTIGDLLEGLKDVLVDLAKTIGDSAGELKDIWNKAKPIFENLTGVGLPTIGEAKGLQEPTVQEQTWDWNAILSKITGGATSPYLTGIIETVKKFQEKGNAEPSKGLSEIEKKQFYINKSLFATMGGLPVVNTDLFKKLPEILQSLSNVKKFEDLKGVWSEVSEVAQNSFAQAMDNIEKIASEAGLDISLEPIKDMAKKANDVLQESLKKAFSKISSSPVMREVIDAYMPMLDGLSVAIGNSVEPLMEMISNMDSLKSILDAGTTIAKAAFSVLEPIIDQLLAPLVGILVVIGKTLGTLLIPILQMLTPIIQSVAGVFTWLYNSIILPIAKFLYTLFAGIRNAFFHMYNAVVGVIGWMIGLKKIEIPNINEEVENLFQAIDTGTLSWEGQQAGGKNGGGGSTGATSTAQNVSYTIYYDVQFNDAVIADKEELKELIMQIAQELNLQLGT